ncbi:MAG: YIP1 family protein [Patescibacteria group bacterium]|nr:YIP1 family protein [Patescibacteria group bacterium]
MTHHQVHFPKTMAGWKDEFKKAFEIVKLNKTVMNAVAADEKATGVAILFFLLYGLFGAVGRFIFPVRVFGVVYRPGIEDMIFRTLVYGAVSFLSMLLITVVAQYLFKGKGDLMKYLRVYGYAMLVGAVMLIPALSFIVMIWIVVLMFVTLQVVHKLDVAETIGSMIIGTILTVIVLAVLSPFLGLSALFYYSAF